MSNASQPPSVAITSLAIRDFRGIERLDLDFRGPDGQPNRLVVLAGPNGCGKTAVLEAALIAAGGHRLNTGKHGPRAIKQGAKSYQITAEFQSNAGTQKIRDDSTLRIPPLPDPKIPHWYFSSCRVPTLVGPVNPTVGRQGRHPAKTDQNRLLNVKQRLVNAATLERFENSLPKLGRYSEVIQVINDAWREFYPDSKHTFAVEVAIPRESDDDGAFNVYLRTPDGLRLEVNFLSAGQLELFLFLSEVALNDDRKGIIVIDEPELHLDPQWHRLILPCLMRIQPRAQLVVATHSQEIYDAAALYERHYLVAENDPRSWLRAKHDGVPTGV
jgi:DNA repair exonuclease SbcCD ATPase subunit